MKKVVREVEPVNERDRLGGNLLLSSLGGCFESMLHYATQKIEDRGAAFVHSDKRVDSQDTAARPPYHRAHWGKRRGAHESNALIRRPAKSTFILCLTFEPHSLRASIFPSHQHSNEALNCPHHRTSHSFNARRPPQSLLDPNDDPYPSFSLGPFFSLSL